MPFSVGWRRSFGSVYSWFKRPHLRIWLIPKALFTAFTQIERWLFISCVVLALVALVGLAQSRQTGQLSVMPIAGGIYREGIIAQSVNELEKSQSPLTDVGLVQVNSTGEIVPALASAWHMDDAHQHLELTLNKDVSSKQIIDILHQQTSAGYWNDAKISAKDDHTLVFELNKPWASYLSELARPIFPFGPYQSAATKKSNMLVFDRNPHALIKPYLEHIQLIAFADQKTLTRAIRRAEVDGAYYGESGPTTSPTNWQLFSLESTREYLAFFNTKSNKLADKTVRARLIAKQPFDQPLALRLVMPEVDALSPFADQLRTDWQAMHVDLTIERYPALTLSKTIIPSRDYDLLLTGLDYGPDGDLYAYWHSSQISSPGLNLAGYRNKDVDRLLDESRLQMDHAERQKRYDAVRKILQDDATYISFGKPKLSFARSQKIKGDVPNLIDDSTDRWQGIASWYRKFTSVPKK